jgi:hypothetical protein
MTLRSAIIVSLICVFAISLAGARNVALQQGRNNDASPDVWGGMHVSLEMNAGGAILEFDCAHGTILQPIKVDAKGEFSVSVVLSKGTILRATFLPFTKVVLKATRCTWKSFLPTKSGCRIRSP